MKRTKRSIKVGDKVSAIENHVYLGVTKRHIGIVTDLEIGQFDNVEVQFKHRKVIFVADEIRRVK